MKHFNYLRHPDGRDDAIKKGFSWTALFSGLVPFGQVIWLCIRGCYLSAFVFLLLGFVLSGAHYAYEKIQFGNDTIRSLTTGDGVFLLFFFLLTLIPALFGNGWTFGKRVRQGFRVVGDIFGSSPVHALHLAREKYDANNNVSENV